MSIFINREQELKILNKRYESNRAEFLLIYGRRRVGKSELIDQFLSQKEIKGIRLLAREESKILQLRKLKNDLAEVLDDSVLKKIEFLEWDAFFEYLGRIKERLVIAIDEVPYIIKEDKAFPSVLQEYWDKILSKSNIFLILCGSSIGMMESLMGYKSPLYGRRTGQILVKPLKFENVLKYVKDVEMSVELYSVFGGTPAYLIEADIRKNIFENITETVAKEDTFICRDVEFILRQELVEPRYYFSILLSIANGNHKIGLICNDTGLSKSIVNKYLSVLIDLRLVMRNIPITESYKSKKGHYFLSDNLFDFWFRFINPYIDKIEKGEVKQLVDDIIKPNLNTYIGKHFEEISQEVLPHIINDFTKIGKWWHKGKEIDIVALNESKKEILFGECKWKDNVNPKKVLKDLEEKTKFVQWHNENRKEIYALFAKSFKSKINEFEGRKVYCFDLKDLERVIKT